MRRRTCLAAAGGSLLAATAASASTASPVVGDTYIDGNTAAANSIDGYARHADGSLTAMGWFPRLADESRFPRARAATADRPGLRAGMADMAGARAAYTGWLSSAESAFRAASCLMFRGHVAGSYGASVGVRLAWLSRRAAGKEVHRGRALAVIWSAGRFRAGGGQGGHHSGAHRPGL